MLALVLFVLCLFIAIADTKRIVAHVPSGHPWAGLKAAPLAAVSIIGICSTSSSSYSTILSLAAVVGWWMAVAKAERIARKNG